MKVSNSALLSPSVNTKLQQIFTAYGGNHSRTDNKKFGGSRFCPEPPSTKLPTAAFVKYGCPWLLRCLVLPLLFKMGGVAFRTPALTNELFVLWLLRCVLYSLAWISLLSFDSLSLVLLPPAFSFVITVCKITTVSTQFHADSRARREVNTCSKLLESISVCHRTAQRGCARFPN